MMSSLTLKKKLVIDLIQCPICEFSSENLTTHILKIHNMIIKLQKYIESLLA